MKATINGITIEGTPQEIMEYQRMQEEQAMKPKGAGYNPWQYKPQITSGAVTTNRIEGCNVHEKIAGGKLS